MTLDSAGGEFVGSPNFSYIAAKSGGNSFLFGALYCDSVTGKASSSGTDTAAFYSYAGNTFRERLAPVRSVGKRPTLLERALTS